MRDFFPCGKRGQERGRRKIFKIAALLAVWKDAARVYSLPVSSATTTPEGGSGSGSCAGESAGRQLMSANHRRAAAKQRVARNGTKPRGMETVDVVWSERPGGVHFPVWRAPLNRAQADVECASSANAMTDSNARASVVREDRTLARS